MKIKKRIYITSALMILGVLLLGGCNSILSRDYMVITPHLENRLDEVVDDELQAETFQELKDCIMHLIEEGHEVGTIRLYNYSGTVDEDTEAAITYTMRYQPLGAYAVEYVSYKSVRILSYYEITLTITYRKTPEEIEAIKKVDSPDDYRRVVLDTYSEYGELLTVEIPWYYSEQYNLQDIIEGYYFKNPLTILTVPSVSIKEYPDVEAGGESGWRRILEISFDYFRSPNDLKQMAQELTAELEASLSDTQLPDDISKFLTLKDLLIQDSVFFADPEDYHMRYTSISTTAYGAVFNGRATSEAFAMAYKALCDIAGIECLVVQGRLDGLLHSWNLVNTDNGWYHIDITAEDTVADGRYFLLTDTQLSESGYRWDTGDYPPSQEEPVVSTFNPDDTVQVLTSPEEE